MAAELPPPTYCPACHRVVRVAPTGAGVEAVFEADAEGAWAWAGIGVMHRPGAGEGTFRLHACPADETLLAELDDLPEPPEGALF